MKRVIKAIRDHLPRRRRRFWRYVSPRRRGVGVLLMVLLMVMVYAYWHLTNEGRVRRLAHDYLRDLTGCKVSVKHAQFRLFGGIELHSVTLRLPGGVSHHELFEAKTVFLRHSPWALLGTGRLHPTEILCHEPVVHIDYDVKDEFYLALRHFAAMRRRPITAEAGSMIKLPTIVFREATLRFAEISGELRTYGAEKRLDVKMVPTGPSVYKVTIEERRAGQERPASAELALNIASGDIPTDTGRGDIASIREMLPTEYRRWLERYDIRGDLRWRRKADPKTGKKILKLELVDFSLKLPPAEGGLSLTGVRGKFALDDDGVTLEGITGQIEQAGRANFKMSGRYGGYEPDSGFDIKLSVENLQLPDPAHAAGAMAEILGKLHRHYRPEGAIDLDATFQRIADGNVLFEGTTELKGLSLTYRGLPYRLDDMRGLIEFTTDRAVFRGVTGRRRGGTFTARGEFSLRGDGKYDVTIDAEDVAFDEQLRKSLPKAYLWVWETLNPAGRALATLQLHSGGEKGRVDVTLKADGKLSFTYSKFPYRVDNIVGDVQITAEKVEVRSVEGSRGAVQCRIDGVIEGINTPQPKTDLTIVARNLPLDETLAAALPAKSRSAFRSLNTSGRADKVTAHVTQAAGKPLDYNILVNIKDVDFKLDAFPYAITGAEGLLTVRPERIIVERLRGRHGRASVLASGQVFTTAENLGIDLQVEMGGLVLDKEFLAALPPAVKKVWDDLSPAGRADMVLSIQQNTPARPGELDYRLVIKPKDMQITYKYFPYRFRVISGEAIVRPGRIELKDLAARTGQMRTSVRGTIESDETGQRAELTVIGRNVPIDAELLAAMPKVLAPLAGRFESGGMCNIDLNKFLFARAAPAEVVGQPAEASSQPSEADGEDPHVAWAVSGTVELKDAMVDIGFAGKKFTGKISGTAARTGKELAIDADVAFESVRVGHHEIIDLKGRLLKGRRSTLLQLLDFSGKAHGGQLAGTVEIRLGEPLQYGLSMVVEDVKLEELFDAGLKDSDKSGKSGKSEEITGLLQGKLEFTAVANDNAKRRATGFVTITKGRMYKLPVLLGLLHVVYLSSPSDAAFTEGYIEYELRGEKLIFTEIHLNGAVLSVVGSGTMDTRTEAIKLNFLAGPPGKIPRLPKLAEEMLNPIFRELLEIQITGTLSKPKRRSVSLRSLEEVLRRLINPSQQEQ